MKKLKYILATAVIGVGASALADAVVTFNGDMVTTDYATYGAFSLDTTTPKLAATAYGDGSGPDVYGAYLKDTSNGWRVQSVSGNGLGMRFNAFAAQGAVLHLFKVDAVSFDSANNELSANFTMGKPVHSYIARYVIEAGGSWYVSEGKDLTSGGDYWTTNATDLSWFNYDPTGDSSNITNIGSLATVTFENIDFIGFVQEATGPLESTGVDKEHLVNLGVSDLVFNAKPSSLDPNIIERWAMEDDGEFQFSHNGTNLGQFSNTNNQQFAQVSGDGTFIFAPSDAQLTSGVKPLASGIDLTKNMVKLSWTLNSVNWTNELTPDAQFGMRLYGGAATNEYVGLRFYDVSDKLWAGIHTSSGLGGLGGANTSRGQVSGSELTAARTISLEIDYQANEIRMVNANNWTYLPGGADRAKPVTNAVNFAAGGITDLSSFQMYYSNWTTGDKVVMDHLQVEVDPYPAAPENVYVADSAMTTGNNGPLTNEFANFTVMTGDYVVVSAAANKSGMDATNAMSFAGSASLGKIGYDFFNGEGPESQVWYVEVKSEGTVDVTFLQSTNGVNNAALAVVNAYVVRSPSGFVDVLNVAGTGSLTNDTTQLGAAYTNVYDFGGVYTGLLFEAASSYSTLAYENADFNVDQVAANKRFNGQISFEGVSGITNIWNLTDETTKQTAILGVAFAIGGPSDPNSMYEDWLAEKGYPVDASDEAHLIEYASGGAATLPSVTEEGGFFIHVHTEWKDADDRGLSYLLELDANANLALASWDTAGITPAGSGDLPGGELVSVTNTVSSTDKNQEFLRLKVTLDDTL